MGERGEKKREGGREGGRGMKERSSERDTCTCTLYM